MTIHTIGDSHCQFGWPTETGKVVSHRIGPILCYSFGLDPLARCPIKSMGIQNGDTVIFCLGEIDCRCHIHKYVENGGDYAQIIKQLVETYFKAITIIVAFSGLSLKQVGVYNAVPPVIKGTVPENPDYPFLGRNQDRLLYTRCFNYWCREKCAEYGYVFFDVYNKYADSNGFLNHELSDGNVHIKNGQYIAEFITNTFGISLS